MKQADRQTRACNCFSLVGHRLVFHPDLPNAAFIGFCRGGVGSIMQGIEMQSRWAALVCSGRRRLPSQEQMKVSVVLHEEREK